MLVAESLVHLAFAVIKIRDSSGTEFFPDFELYARIV